MNADFEDGLRVTWLMRYTLTEVMLLPDEEQDAIAANILELLDDEEAWLARVESATRSVEEWKEIARQRIRESVAQCERGRADITAGRCKEFPEAFLELGRHFGFTPREAK